ncbi:LysR substrate-binding domain-containing protein [Pedobacter rhizosphaerae]|uniref:DNA-binding transcriptional regulator, LysR family n=1 Tax=Pedobacter rhizosphaerae TaxID=390241 RepID=A0A1H9V6B9_9SPHI|nr:LysR substrate-binding domain-containing protein [Pedobacter rhizosphaerae]SES17128.1 DNA-binding transcriptional regulator, LysR family [Pedobacter rhizosphaerae]
MGYQIELRHLKYFQVLAEELRFRKAAEKLFISQPGLSRQIKQMEEIYGVDLFVRNKRKVELSTAGVYLKAEVDFIFNHLETIKTQLDNIGKGRETELRIGFLGSAAQNVVPELIFRLNKTYPGIQTLLEEMPNQLQVQLIEKDKLDLGFVRLPRVPEGISRHPIFEDTFSLVVPEDHPVNERNFQNIRQLANEPFIFFSSEDSPLYYDLIMSICEDSGFRPKVFHKSVHAPTIFKLVEQGLGVAIVPSSLQLGYHLKIRFFELKNIPQRTELSVIWKESNRNPALQNVIALLRG